MESKINMEYLFLIVGIFLVLVFSSPIYAAENSADEKAIVFLLDASSSMKTNDPERLAIDSIAQLIYTIPTDYKVGFVAYNSEITAEQPLVTDELRSRIMDEAEQVKYTGYSNAGAGLWNAVESLKNVWAKEKYIVFLSDGEILMESDSATEESQILYQNAIEQAKAEGIRIYVIGLGDEMEDTDNPIFDAAAATGGRSYYTPQALDIQNAIDSVLDEELDIKRSTVAIVDADGELEHVSVELPYLYADKVRVLLTGTAPIHNLGTSFQADSANQVNGERYSLIEANEPYGKTMDLSFEGTKGSQIRIDVIPEYRVIPRAEVTYTDEIPVEEDALYYDRTAQISYTFCDLDNQDIRLWTDSYFTYGKLPVTVNGQTEELALKDGTLSVTVPVEKAETIEAVLDYSKLPVNVIGEDTVTVELEDAPLLPAEDPPYAWIAAGIAGGVLFLFFIAFLIWHMRKPKPIPLPPEDRPEPSKYSYVGKLNIYVTQTPSGYDIPPLAYNLFRLPAGRVVSLKEVLENCNVKEELPGAEAIYFKPGANRNLIVTNNSDCTVMKNREILMKKKSYQLTPDSKVDITFEDELSEMMFQYKDLKPSEMW